MNHHSGTNLAIYIFFTLIAVSALFLFKDIQNGNAFALKFNFFAVSATHDKEQCGKAQTENCYHNPISEFFSPGESARAEAPESALLDDGQAATETEQVPPETPKAQPRFK